VTTRRPEKLHWVHRLRSNVLYAPPFVLGTAVFGSMSLLASTWDKSGSLQHSLARRWARASVLASGARLQVIGLENIPGYADRRSHAAAGIRLEQPPCVFAANHTSYMDTPVVFASLPFQFRILAKKELWGLPFIGWYLNRSGQIPIDTENPRATISSLGAGVKTLRQGLSVFVFPEGGRTPNGELQPFLNGAAYLALRANVPLVPVALVGVYDLLPMHTRHFYHAPRTARKTLKLVVGKPIDAQGLTLRDSDTLTARLRAAIAELIAEHS